MGDKCTLMRPKTPRVKDKCGRQVEDKCKIMRPKASKCEGQLGDKCKNMRPKAPRVKDKCGRQVEDKCKLMRASTGGQVLTHAAQRTQSGRQVWETSGRQV